MTREEAEREFDLAWNELVAEGSIKHMGDHKWIAVDTPDKPEPKNETYAIQWHDIKED